MFEKWVRETQFGAFGSFRSRRNDHAIKKLAEALQTKAATYTLSAGREVKLEVSYEYPALCCADSKLIG